MKRFLAIAAVALPLVAALVMFFFPLKTHNYATETSAIQAVSDSFTSLSVVDETASDEVYYSKRQQQTEEVDVALKTSAAILRASEAPGAVGSAVQTINRDIEELQKNVAAVHQTALNHADDTKAVYNLNQTIDTYNKHVDDYNNAKIDDELPITSTYVTISGGAALLSLGILVWLGITMRKRTKLKKLIREQTYVALASALLLAVSITTFANYHYMVTDFPDQRAWALVVAALAPVVAALLVYHNQRLNVKDIKRGQLTPVTPALFLIYCTLTFGVYYFWRLWRMWLTVGVAERKSYWGFLGALFSPITCFWLFPKVHKLAVKTGRPSDIGPYKSAVIFLLTNLVFGALISHFDGMPGLFFAVISGPVVGLAMLPAVLEMNNYLNRSKKSKKA